MVLLGHEVKRYRDQLQLIPFRGAPESRQPIGIFIRGNGYGGTVKGKSGASNPAQLCCVDREIANRTSAVKFGIVLMTPDDFGYSKADGAGSVQPRARQNVVLELGMLIAAIGWPS